MTFSRKKEPKRPPLINKSELAIQTARQGEHKPDAWFRSEVHALWVRRHELSAASRQPAPERWPMEAAHVWIGSDGAKGKKPSDIFLLPLTGLEHIPTQHFIGERTFWARFGQTDPAAYAVRSYALLSPCRLTVVAAENWLQFGDWRGAPADVGLLAARR